MYIYRLKGRKEILYYILRVWFDEVWLTYYSSKAHNVVIVVSPNFRKEIDYR